MGRIYLQPTSNKVATQNFKKTVLKTISISSLVDKGVSENVVNMLWSEYPKGTFNAWGVKNGYEDRTFNTWANMNSGDIVLFTKPGGIFYKAVIKNTSKSPELANALWGLDEDGETWENIYLINELEEHEISYESFNGILGYKQSYVVQGFRGLDQEKSDLLYNFEGFDSENYDKVQSEKDYEETVKRLEGKHSLDNERKTLVRREQKFLRDYLFPSETSHCSICMEEFPIDMLVAAHVKKRSVCTPEERLDYKNIVTPMCKFGCDELYEKGYLFVSENGLVEINDSKVVTPIIEKYINKVSNNKCIHHNSQTEQYFKYHRDVQIKND